MSVPNWVIDPTLSEFEQRKLSLAYRLRYAALQHNKAGSVKKLSLAAGFSADLTHHAMHVLGHRVWGFSPEAFDDSGSASSPSGS